MVANEKRHARGSAAQPAEGATRHLAQQAAHQLAAKLLQVLRRHAHARSGDEFLDVPPVQLHAVGQANGVHHLDL